ncbi:MAG: hypothetical protein PHC62_06625 [Candidatus Izemoplasmatales bacterium]|jgi:hypothetical protein|nr:hypothetical protein [Candidatus Izemoplasmatales bacterium]
MEEIFGMNVRLSLNDTHGFVTLTGKVIKISEHFLLLDTTLGPIYVSFNAIKTMQVVGESDEER